MPKHPPLCPKTRLRFGPHGVFVGRGHSLFHRFDTDRELIARYQACAWQDRASRWRALWDRCDLKAHSTRDYTRASACFSAFDKCARNARAWREWEKANA